MKKKILAGLLIAASVAASLAGCGASTNNNGNNGNSNTSNNSEKNNTGNSTVNIAGGAVNYEFEERQIGNSNVASSIIIADMIAEANAGSNIMYSPTSLNMALGLAGEGASGTAAELLESFFGTATYGDRAAELLEGFEGYNTGKSRNGYTSKLEVANALWVDKRITLNKEFEKLANDVYRANAAEVDFTNAEKACKTINKWAKDNTNGLIPQIISEELITPDTRLCITNSIYFESAWSEEWNLHDFEEDFTLSNGETQSINYMYNEGGAYFENEYATAFSCSYENGLKFIGILPKDEGEFTIEGLDIEGLLATQNYNHDELYYKMPTLNFETSNELSNIFKAMGMGALFEEGAGFDKIADEKLYISSIIQKTKLELDQYGTKAAAVTAIMMDSEGCAMPDEEPVIRYVYLDRPFAFLIYDQDNNEILFMGKVVTALN